MNLRAARLLLAGALCATHAYVADAAGPKGEPATTQPTHAGAVSFTKHVAPVLVRRCQGCHGPEKSKGDYRLDTFERLLKPGSGEAPPVKAGKPADSEIYRLIVTEHEEDRMPQKADPLPLDEIAVVERWIREGATFDGPDRAASLSSFAAGAYPKAPEAYPRPVPVLALAFSPDGQTLAAGGYHEVTLWDAREGKLLGRIGDLPRQVQSLAWSDEGALVAVAGGTPGVTGEVALLDPGKKAKVKSLERTVEAVFAVSFSPDGARLAAGGADGAVRVFDVKSGRLERRIEQHADWVTSVAFSRDGSKLLTASRDKTARVFDAATGEMLSAYMGHDEPPAAAAFSPDGKLAYSGGREKAVHAWDVNEGKKSAQFAGAGADVLRVVVAGDALFVAAADKTVRRYSTAGKDAKDGKESKGPVRTYDGMGDWVFALALHEKTNRLAAASHGGEVRVWDADDGRLITSFVAAPGFREASSKSTAAP